MAKLKPLLCAGCGFDLGEADDVLHLRLTCSQCGSLTQFESKGLGDKVQLLSYLMSEGAVLLERRRKEHEATAHLMRSNHYVDSHRC